MPADVVKLGQHVVLDQPLAVAAPAAEDETS
jgi:hypothetical protein